MNQSAIAFFLVFAANVLASPSLAVTPADRCVADKLKVAAKYNFCRQMADARAIRRATAPDYRKCEDTFLANWARAEARGEGTCPTAGDAPQFRAAVSSRATGVTEALDGKTLPACGVASFRDSEFLIVAAQAEPGLHPGENNPILRYLLSGTGDLVALPPIPPDTLGDARTVAFNAEGELFVGNRQGSAHGRGGISRFLFDEFGYPLPNGEISANDIHDVEDLSFCPNGELFAVDAAIPTIKRYTFTVDHQAIANGTIAVPNNGKIACSPLGEIFFAPSGGPILRFGIPAGTAAAVPNGSFAVGTQPNHLTFNPTGELFISDGDLVHRVLFDGDGMPVDNGTITVNGADGIAFSGAGELFVSGHVAGGILRFIFSTGTAVPNGHVDTAQLGGIAVHRLTP